MSARGSLLATLFLWLYSCEGFVLVKSRFRWNENCCLARASYSAGGPSQDHARLVSCAQRTKPEHAINFADRITPVTLRRSISPAWSMSEQGIDGEQTVGSSAALPESLLDGTETEKESPVQTDSAVATLGETGDAPDLSRGISFEAPKPSVEDTEEVGESKKVRWFVDSRRYRQPFVHDSVSTRCLSLRDMDSV